MVTVISNEMNQLQAIIGKGHEMNDLQTIEMGGGGVPRIAQSSACNTRSNSSMLTVVKITS
jgi:hypothetical protein